MGMFARFAVLAVCVLAIGGSHASVAAAQQPEVGRFAQAHEIVGAWELLPLPQRVRRMLNAVEPWPLPHQYFLIDRNGQIKWMMTNKEDGRMTRQRLRHILAPLPSNRYSFLQTGFIEITYPDIPNHREVWSVNLITRSGSVGPWSYQRGDLLMSLDNGRGQAIYRRHLRRLR